MSVSKPSTQLSRFTSSLKVIATNYALRCDAKFADDEALAVDERIRSVPYFEIGEFLPLPFVKGIQPAYLDQATEDSALVVNTLSIQNLSISVDNCRPISLEYFDNIPDDKKLRNRDVLLTVDGGVSIGKPALFELDGPFAADSHVAILRPVGLLPLSLVYLLACPLGQKHFQRAESGASGQTTVTEDDIRRFIYPRSILEEIDKLSEKIEKARSRIAAKRAELQREEENLWKQLDIQV